MKKTFLLTLWLIFIVLPLSLWAEEGEKKGKIEILKIAVIEEGEPGKIYEGDQVLSYPGGKAVSLLGRAQHPTEKIKSISVGGESAELLFHFRESSLEVDRKKARFVRSNFKIEDEFWELEITVHLENGESFSKTFEGEGGMGGMGDPMDSLMEKAIDEKPVTVKDSSGNKETSSNRGKEKTGYKLSHVILASFQGLLGFFAFLALVGLFAQSILKLGGREIPGENERKNIVKYPGSQAPSSKDRKPAPDGDVTGGDSLIRAGKKGESGPHRGEKKKPQSSSTEESPDQVIREVLSETESQPAQGKFQPEEVTEEELAKSPRQKAEEDEELPPPDSAPDEDSPGKEDNR